MTLFTTASVATTCYVVLAFIGTLLIVPIIQAMQDIHIFKKEPSVVIVVVFCELCLVELIRSTPDGLFGAGPSKDAFVIMTLTYTAIGFTLLFVTLLRFAIWLFRSIKNRYATGGDGSGHNTSTC